ncbi:WD40-repeat-containing domain protein, partial [Baffinella frigidus]
TTLAYTGGAEYMFCGTEDGAVKCINVASGQVCPNASLPYEVAHMRVLLVAKAVSRRQGLKRPASAEALVREVSAITPEGFGVCSLQCAPDQSDTWLATTSDGNLAVFRAVQNRCAPNQSDTWLATTSDGNLAVFRAFQSQCASDQSDTWLATTSDSNLAVFRFDMTSGRSELVVRHAFPHSGTLLAAFSPSQPSCVVCCGEAVGRGLVFFNLDERRVERSLATMDQVAMSLSISPSGYLITLGTAERLVKVVDFEEGTFQDFTGHSDAVASLAFSPSGALLVSSANTDIISWDVCV